jgi:hypothetical protein
MLRWLFALLVFVVVSPVSDAVNGYMKAPDGSCSALAVLRPNRMAFLCSDGIAVAQVTSLDLPDPFHPSCLKEALLGIQAMATLKLWLYASGDIRTFSFYRDEGAFHAGVLVDLEPVDSIYLRHMEATTLNRTRGDWCSK